MLEFVVDLVEKVKNIITFIPRKINDCITVYEELHDTSKKQARIIEAYKDRMKKIQFWADCGNCDKIIELVTIPIEDKF